jgi:hypothetical protein
MTERLLQFIWQFQYFNASHLCSKDDEPIRIIHPGLCNTNQGPDFSNARIMIGSATWIGSVELHIKASDWEKHRHSFDRNYQNVVLHVVWEDDTPPGKNPANQQSALPLVELKTRVSKLLLQRYEELMLSPAFIPCGNNAGNVSDLTWRSWKDRLLIERLGRKAAQVEELLKRNNFHWEESFWWMLARTFGMAVNAEAFEAIARSLPISLLGRHKNQIHQLEALLLGQAGMLAHQFEEDYPNLLKREYRFMKKKYGLAPVAVPLYSLRMRPSNFPAVRLAQLAMLVHQSSHLFSKLKDAPSAATLRTYFEVTANDYWHYHYRFGHVSAYREKSTGESFIDSVIINTVAPVLFAYGHYHHDDHFKERAIESLEQTRAEKNKLIGGFEKLGVSNNNARESQALIELKNEYCDHHRCLECAIGNTILRSGITSAGKSFSQ